MAGKTTIYDDNQFAYHKRTRHEQITSGQTRRKGHLPIWLDLIFVVIIVGAAGAVGFVLTHPSPHRSAIAIASNFVEQVGSGNYAAAARDVDPSDQASALSNLNSENGFVGGQFANAHTIQYDSSTVSGTSGSVVLKACNSSLACNPLPPVPCIEIKGSWYVSWVTLLQSLTPN
jgi:hypothetical protein